MIQKIKVMESPMTTNCYIISDENKACVVIDPDCNPDAISKYIDENELNFTHILLTHGHYDHIGSVAALKEKYHCKVAAGEKERELLLNSNLNLSIFIGQKMQVPIDIALKEGDIFTVGSLNFKVLETPGHTVGSLSFLIENYLISGDTLFQGSCGRTDFPTGDWNTIKQSLRRLKELDKDYTVLPGHGPATKLSIEKRMNPFMQE